MLWVDKVWMCYRGGLSILAMWVLQQLFFFCAYHGDNDSGNVSKSGSIVSENDKNYKITASIDNRRLYVLDIELLLAKKAERCPTMCLIYAMNVHKWCIPQGCET